MAKFINVFLWNDKTKASLDVTISQGVHSRIQMAFTIMRLKHGLRQTHAVFQDGYDQHLTMTTWVARSKEPSLSKVQFVAILIRILDLIKYGYFL